MPETRSPLTRGFWRNWPTPKALLFVAFGLIFFAASSGTGGWAAERLTALALFLFVWNWIADDRRRFPEAASQYQGLALVLLWPIAMPVYLVQTRGWRRALVGVMAVVATVVAATSLGAVVPLDG